eukprot:scaffold106731_cov56-Cyclotella_meneghiniana.AAC.1
MTGPIYFPSSPPLAFSRCRLQKQTMAIAAASYLIPSIGRLDDIASARDQVVKTIEGATNHFPPRTGVKMPSSGLRYPLGTHEQ